MVPARPAHSEVVRIQSVGNVLLAGAGAGSSDSEHGIRVADLVSRNARPGIRKAAYRAAPADGEIVTGQEGRAEVVRAGDTLPYPCREVVIAYRDMPPGDG